MNLANFVIANAGFTGSVAFGILAMLIVGGSWCLVGLVMGKAPKQGIDTGIVQLMGNVVSVLCSLGIILWQGGFPDCPAKVLWLTCGCLALGGFFNFFQLQLMAQAMQIGPNGIIWAIIQSAFFFPFLGGVIFFGMELTAIRVVGIVCILLALIGFGMSKDNSGKGGFQWKFLAFVALGIGGIQQNLTTAPSYFQEARVINSVMRTMSTSLGAIVAAAVYFAATYSRQHLHQLQSNCKRLRMWGYVGVLQFFSLLFAYTLMYPGMNALADHDMGGMCYTLMVGSCIVSFTLTSIFLLKEKIHPIQYLALLLCTAGLVFICL